MISVAEQRRKMERKQQGRSGIAFFFVAVGLIFTAIAATVLLANEQRHLKQLLAGLGFAMTPPQTERPPEAARGPRKSPNRQRHSCPPTSSRILQRRNSNSSVRSAATRGHFARD